MDPDILPKFQATDGVTCPHAPECPGCPLIELAYSDQLAHKQALVRSEIGAYVELQALQVAPCVAAAEPLGYRTRAKLVASGAALGLFARGTHRVVDIPSCKVLDGAVAHVAHRLRSLLPGCTGIEGVDIARVGQQLLLTLIVAEDAEDSALQRLAEQLTAAFPALVNLAVARRAPGAVQLLAGGHSVLQGQAEVRHTPAPGVPYHYVAFGAFVQAHPAIARAINERLRDGTLAASRTTKALRVLELYAGSGALALELAAAGVEVTAVESYAPACERLQRAAREQSLTLHVAQGDAAQRLATLVDAGETFDVVLVNPPRRGLSPAVRELISRLLPGRLGYVSCRPSTLARDLAHFARLGLACDEACPFDMMPLTDQVETLVWLAPHTAKVAVFQRGEHWIALLKGPHESLGTEDTSAGGLRQRAGAELSAHRPLFALERDTSGIALFVADTEPVPQARRRVFNALVKGVVRARGTLSRGRPAQVQYVREQVIAGHSLVRAEARDDISLRRAFRVLGHPVLGDARADAASAKYFALRHGLDRPFLHLGELELASDTDVWTLEAPLPADLRAVLHSMKDNSANAQTVEEHTDRS